MVENLKIKKKSQYFNLHLSQKHLEIERRGRKFAITHSIQMDQSLRIHS